MIYRGSDTCLTLLLCSMHVVHITKYQTHFWGEICTLFSGARWFFSRLRLQGTQGGHLYTMVKVRVPVGLRGASAGRSKARNLASNRGIAFRLARANQAHANPKNVIVFIFTSLLLLWKYQSSCQRLGSHGTTAALQAFPFVTTMNGASACGFVSVRVCACHCRILQR